MAVDRACYVDHEELLMRAKIITAGLGMVLLAGCTDANIARMVSSSSKDVVAFKDERWGNVWVVWHGSRFFRLGQGGCCVSPNGRYAISTMPDRLDRVLIVELDPDRKRSSTVRVNSLPPSACPFGIRCDDIRAVVQYYRDGYPTDRNVETGPKLWKQIRLADLHVSDATQAGWDGVPPQATVPGEEIGAGERRFKVSKDLVIIEMLAPIAPNRIFLESGGKRQLLLQEDGFTILEKWFLKLGLMYP
jgi:hypothetical protein